MPRTSSISAAIVVLLLSTTSCRRSEPIAEKALSPTTPATPVAKREVPPDPLAELALPQLPPARAAEICEAEQYRLSGAQRTVCATAHLSVARTLLREKNYAAAREALAFAETEGAPLQDVRKLRRGIPNYEAIAAPRDDTGAEREASAQRDIRRSAANRLTMTFSGSRLRGFEIRGAAAGPNCDVLLVTTYVKMEDPMISALHRGEVMYGQILPGGTGGFAAANGFRGVVYRDGDDTTWAYGEVGEEASRNLKACS